MYEDAKAQKTNKQGLSRNRRGLFLCEDGEEGAKTESRAPKPYQMCVKAAKTPHSGEKRPEGSDPRPKGLKRLYKAKKRPLRPRRGSYRPIPPKRRPSGTLAGQTPQEPPPRGLTKPKPLQKGRTEAVWGKIGASRPLRGVS